MALQPLPPAAAILAAGLGSRLGYRPKATLKVGGLSVLERIVAALRGAGVQEVSVVIGPYLEQLQPLVVGCGAYPLLHQVAQPSLVESQRVALDDHRSRFADHDLMLVLGDLALLGEQDVLPLLTSWHRRNLSVHAQVPVVGGVRGHPLILSSWAGQQICTLPRRRGIRDWLASHPDSVASVETDRPAYVSDLDTPADVEALRDHLYPITLTWPSP
jgi:CTP:molybdopterin cytidylyltransferase MocA